MNIFLRFTKGLNTRFLGFKSRENQSSIIISKVSRISEPIFMLILVILFLGTAFPVSGAEKFCSDPPYYGVIDGDIRPVPTQITIDTDCTFRNFPDDKPLTTTVNFHTNDPTIYLIIFDNVTFTGHMACANVDHRIWFSNSSDYGSSNACQDLFIPVETIDKQNPAGQTTAAIGVPFTYTLTLPSMSLGGDPSPNDLHSVTFWDDLGATGADLTFVGINAYKKGTGESVALTPETDPSAPGGVWTPKNLSYEPIPLIEAGEQVVVEVTVVPDDTVNNAAGTQFFNTAKWMFGRLIDGVYYEPLPGEWGVTEPMTIVKPNLVVTKTGPASVINLGEWAEFTIDVHNSGIWAGNIWHLNITDLLPVNSSNSFDGGMCDLPPEITSVALEGRTLILNTDYQVNYTGCELSLTLLEAGGLIGPDEHLLVSYRTKVDADSQSGAVLTNIAAATQWSNDVDSSIGQTYSCQPTNGTPGVADCQDAHNLLVTLSGFFFEKSVTDPDTGDTISTAMPGETVRYKLQMMSIDDSFTGLRFYDDLGNLNSSPAFEPGSLTLVSYPTGADISGTDPNGGTNNTGVLDVRNLNISAGDIIQVVFDVTVSSSLTEGSVVLNQSELLLGAAKIADSDDPNIDGQADPALAGDEDPTQLQIYVPQPQPPTKALISPVTAAATIGEDVVYEIRVPGTPLSRPLYDVVITDVLDDNLEYAGFAQSSGPAVLDNSGAGNLSFSITQIPEGQQAVILLNTRIRNVVEAQQGVSITNTVSFTYADTQNGTAWPALISDPVTLSIVEPHVSDITKSASVSSPATGDIYRYSITLSASDGVYASDVFDVTVIDTLGAGLVFAGNPTVTTGSGVDADNSIGEPFVTGDGSAAAPQTLVWSMEHNNADIDIARGSSVTVSYDVQVLNSVVAGQVLTNNASAQWTGIDGASDFERDGTDGIGGLNDYVTPPVTTSVTAVAAIIVAQKTVTKLVADESGTITEMPGTAATPGDRLRYTIDIENTTDIPLNGFSLVDALDGLNIDQYGQSLFQPDSIENVSTPAGSSFTVNDRTLTVNNLDIGPNESLTVSFEAVLIPVITSGTIVLNQGEIVSSGTVLRLTDDPNITGSQNPTETLISSAPALEVLKTSTVMSADPTVLMAGGTLRYTITIRNTGNEDAVDVMLRDYTPANTAYVSGSTTLNGEPVQDPGYGFSPLESGIQINAPSDDTPGYLRADSAADANNPATVTFDVIVDQSVIDGYIVENQGFVSYSGKGSGPQSEQPSDDPSTPAPNDPTRNVVGNLPLIYALKTVEIYQDEGSTGIVDPGDILRYTIVINNSGAVPASNTILTDGVPDNTTYIGNSLRLNGASVAPDDGFFPLISGLAVNSGDNPGAGILSPGENAVITFEARVNDGAPPGTLIVNQGTVTSEELPPQLTDADGDASNGNQETIIPVGEVQLININKQVIVLDGGSAEAGGYLEYVIQVNNIGTLPVTNLVLTDNLNPLLGDQISYIDGFSTLNGSSIGVLYDGGILTADYASSNGDLQPDDSAVLRFRVRINQDLVIGTTITNTGIATYSSPPRDVSASVSIDIGGTPGTASMNGKIWHDTNLNRLYEGPEQQLEGWIIELYRNNQVIADTSTDNDGNFLFSGITPNDGTTDLYELRFHAAGAGPNTPSLGWADSPFTNHPQRISDITVSSGNNLQNLNLPIWPNGAVYNSIARTPIAGARLTLLAASTGALLPEGCFDDPQQQNQITALDGFYKFDLNFSDAACSAGETYLIAVTPPAGYMDLPSRVIPPETHETTPAFSVPDCPGSLNDAVPSTNEYCEASTSINVPSSAVESGTDGTIYYLHLLLSDENVPGHSQIFNNFIPVDPLLDGAVAIIKSSPLINVTRGELVPYRIIVDNVYGTPLTGLNIIDRFPAGFKYVTGSARMDGRPAEPEISDSELIWGGLGLSVNQRYELELLFVPGSGVSEGKYVNRAQVINPFLGTAVSNEATATVQVVPDPDLDCTDVIGKVFDDRNMNGYQDEDEAGLANVRIVTVRGLNATTDEFGRFHITCAAVPDEDRGSNFLLKLDERSLPAGYRVTTENPRVQRATRGKMIRINFGATIHRVVRMDINDEVFEPETCDFRPQWIPRITQLMEELKKAPSILRVSYLGDVEKESLAKGRLNALKEEISSRWSQKDENYTLVIETELFWRRGGPKGGKR